jgi:nitrogenase iron protein
MKRIAVYGKGGIGKSTISSNMTAALCDKGIRVMQIGCDPKHDSTRLLTNGKEQQTVLDYLRDTKENERNLEDVIEHGYKGCICVEAGGPEPGVGCAGRGIISAFDLLEELGIDNVELDIVTYDVLGDVVCGGFAVPLRNGYADLVYVVTSGEFMSIYAANNILKGTANYNPDRIGGIIFNSRGDDEEKERVKRFSDAVGIPIIAEFPRSRIFMEAERAVKTVVELFPSSEETEKFRKLAERVINGKKYTAKHLSETELEAVVLGRPLKKDRAVVTRETPQAPKAGNKRTSGNNRLQKEIVHGCSFAGTLCITLAVDGLATVLHSPSDCAHYAVQMVTNALRRSMTNAGIPIKPFARPNVRCSDMDDSDMIFGSISTLETNVNEIISEGNKTIAVVTSCPSGIIGEDIDGMIERIRSNNPDVTIIPIIEDGNICGDYMQGATDACIEIIRALSVKGKKERSVNLVGMKTFGINTLENVQFVTDVLKRMGIKMNCTCIGNTDVESIRNIPNAELCMLMTPDTMAVETMRFMNEMFGLKATNNFARPGMREAELWIKEMGEHFNENEKAEQIVNELRTEFGDRLNALKPRLEGKKLYIAGMKRDINWMMEMALGCGMNVVRFVVTDIIDRADVREHEERYGMEMIAGGRIDLLKGMKDRTERVLDPYIPVDLDMREWIRNDANEKRPDLMLSMYPIKTDTDARTCFIPMNPDVTPFAGTDLGMLCLRALKTPLTAGWRKDVVKL